MGRGFLNKQIAYDLGLSEKTVKAHRGNVTRKLQVNSVAELVRLLDRLDTEESFWASRLLRKSSHAT